MTDTVTKPQGTEGAKAPEAPTKAPEAPTKTEEAKTPEAKVEEVKAPEASVAKSAKAKDKPDGVALYKLRTGKHRYKNEAGEIVVAVGGQAGNDIIPLSAAQVADFADRIDPVA